MDLEALGDVIDSLEVPGTCAGLRAAHALRERLDAAMAPAIDAVARSGEWEIEGAVSMPSWMRANLRMTAGAAKTELTAAARAAELPVMAEAWRSGALSTGQVRAIVLNVAERHVDLFASHEEDVIPKLVPLSVMQTAQVMNDWRERADALDADRDDRDPKRELFFSKTIHAIREMRGSFDNVYGEVIDAALAVATTRDGETERRSPAQRRADALLDICRFFLDNQKAKSAGRHRPHVNVIIDFEDLDGPGRFISGDTASADFVGTLLCDSNVHRVVTQGRSAILNYGRSVRTAPPDLFNALALRDGHCREPGCDRPPSWCDAHHVEMWDDGGETSLANCVLRCTRHHHQLHRRRKLGWTERVEADGTLVITDPSGHVYSSRPDGPLAQRQLIAV